MLLHNYMTALAVVACIAGAGIAKAEDPSQLQSVQKNLHADFEKQRLIDAKQRYFVAPRKPVASREVTMEVIIEKVLDGQVVVSVPYDPKQEKVLDQGGYYLAKTREEAFDHVRFAGRLFTMLMIDGTEYATYERLVGQEAKIKIRVDNSGQKVFDARLNR